MSRPAAPRLYPLGPLERAARRYRHVALRHELEHHADQADPITIIVEVCKLSGSEVVDARTRGLTAHQADRCALRLGLHPNDIWGWDWWDGTEARDRTAVIFAGIRRFHGTERRLMHVVDMTTEEN